MRAAIYARISQDRNGEALGVERQQRLCLELVDRLGWEVVERYVENDVSAYSGKERPQYAAMLNAARAGTVDAIVALDTDRLTRHPRELEDLIDLAESHRIGLATVGGRIDLGTTDGRLVARITGAVARQESERKAERTRRKIDELAQAGKWSGGPRRFGYSDGMVEIVAPEAEAIRQAARAVLDEGASWRSIARAWDEAGLLTARGNPWRPASVRRTLTAPHLAGLRLHRGEVVGQAEWDPILSRVDHERLAAMIRKGRPTTPTRRLLSGLLVCGKCGSGLVHGTTDKRRRIYYCKRQPGEPNRCGRLSVSAVPTEDAVRAMALDALAGPGLAAAVHAHDQIDDARTIAELDDLAARKADAAGMFADGLIGRGEYLSMRDRIEEQVREVSGRLSAPVTDTSMLDDLRGADDLTARWEAADDGWRRALLGLLLDRIEVTPVGARTQRFDPARLVPSWKA